jgi:hypothetical protein
MSEPVPELRVGDRERGETDALLRDALADGVLSLTEYEERAGQCWAARTRSELDAVVRDLPGARAPVPAVAGAPPGGPNRITAVMSESELASPVLPGQDVEATAVLGTAKVDLRREDLPPEVHVRATALLGEVKVHVPPGTTVHLSGSTVMGERKAKLGPPVAGGSVVHVHSTAVLGSVVVDDRQRKGGLLPAPPSSTARAWSPARLRTTDGSVRMPPAGEPVPQRRARPVRSLLGKAVGAAVPVALIGGGLYLGAQVVTSEDGASVFGSRTITVSDTDGEVEVGVLFGSVTVVVPEDVTVRTAGTVVFGSTECQACAGTPGGGSVVVRGIGAFGSVEVVRPGDPG